MESASQQDRPRWLPAELYPFESRHLQVEGAWVHYVDEGTGPTLLLLHGNPTWSFLYQARKVLDTDLPVNTLPRADQPAPPA